MRLIAIVHPGIHKETGKLRRMLIEDTDFKPDRHVTWDNREIENAAEKFEGKLADAAPAAEAQDDGDTDAEEDDGKEEGRTQDGEEVLDAEGRANAIVSAIDLVEHDDKNWTSQGKPTVAALEKILGFDITSKERNAAWDSVQNGD